MWLKCVAESPWKLYLDFGQIHMMGLFSLRHGGQSQVGLPWVSGKQPPPTLSKLARAGPARSTPPRTVSRAESVY